MTLDGLLELLHTHSVALQSSTWPRPHGPFSGPALYLDLADTRALIAELTRLTSELAAARASGARRVSDYEVTGAAAPQGSHAAR